MRKFKEVLRKRTYKSEILCDSYIIKRLIDDGGVKLTKIKNLYL